MAKKYDIVNTSLLSAIYDGSLIDVEHRAKTALENGRLVAIDADGTVRYAVTADAKVYLLATVEKMYDTLQGLTEFRVEIGELLRMMGMRAGDRFGTTATSGALIKGDKVILETATGKFIKSVAPAGTENFIGEVTAIGTLGYDKTPSVTIKVIKA